MSDEMDLKKCPFCGGKAKFFALGNEYEVYCTDCHASTGWYSQTGEGRELAAAAWNRRAS